MLQLPDLKDTIIPEQFNIKFKLFLDKFRDYFLPEPRSKKKFIEDHWADKTQNAAKMILQELRCNSDEDATHDVLLNLPNTTKPDDPLHLIKHYEEKVVSTEASTELCWWLLGQFRP